MREQQGGPGAYKDMLKELHPERYSDSVPGRDAKLLSEFLDFFLDTLTSKNKEHEFEGFCRQMVRLRICPNLIIQTGPTGGGDSKVDTETFPVDSGLAEVSLPAESVTAAGERWAFAISAKREWQQKVRSDVSKIKEVEDSLHRGYTRVFFISNQLISDKKRAETEDKLRSESGFDVRILDRSWLVETALSSPESRLATVRELGMSESLLDDRKTGARDSAREVELAEIESRIQATSSDKWRERIRLADRAAELICELERPDYEIANALNRHLNLAQSHGDPVHKAEALYLFLYRTVANCEEPDDASVCCRYAEFEKAVLSDKSKINISRLITLWVVFATRRRIGLSKFDESAHADVIDRIIEDLSQDGNRRSTYFEVALCYQPMRLVRGAAPSDVLAESKSLLEGAAGVAGVDFSVLAALFNISDDFVEEPLFDKVAELLYRRTKEEEGARALAPSLLKRGRKLSESGRHYDAITQMTRALTCLRGAQDRLDFIAACLELAQECYDVEFIWASRCLCRMALSLSFDAYYGDGVLTPAMLASCHMLKNFELMSGNLQGAVRLLVLERFVRKFFPEAPSNSDEDLNFDQMVGVGIVGLSEEELRAAIGLPEFLEDVGLSNASLMAMLAFGHYDEKSAEEFESPEEVDRFCLENYERLAESSGFPKVFSLGLVDELVLSTRIVGCLIEVETPASWQCYEAGCTLLSCLEGFLATALKHELLSFREKLSVRIEKATEGQKPFVVECDGEWISVAVGDIDGLVHPDLVKEVGEMVSRVLAHALCLMFPAPGTLEKIQSIAESDYALERAFVLGDSLSLSGDFIDGLPWGFDPSAEREGALQYVRNGSLKACVDDEIVQARSELRGTSEPKEVVFGWPEGEDNAPFVRQGSIRHESIIDSRLWNQAKWRGFGYIAYPGKQPCLAVIFSNDVGLRIFDTWIRNGQADISRLRISIIKNVSREQPLVYRGIIGSSIPGLPSDAKEGSVVSTLVRFMDITPSSHVNLDAFEKCHAGANECRVLPAIGEEGQQPCFYFDKAVTVSSDAIRILQAGEISREDLFEVNVFHPGDSPLVEEGELGEILSIIEEKTRAGRIRQP